MVATIDRTESSYLLYVGLVERSRVSSTKYIENLMLSVLAIDSATTCYNKAYRSKHNLFSQHSTFQQTLHSNIVNHGMLLHAPPKRISQYITSQRKLSGMHASTNARPQAIPHVHVSSFAEPLCHRRTFCRKPAWSKNIAVWRRRDPTVTCRNDVLRSKQRNNPRR